MDRHAQWVAKGAQCPQSESGSKWVDYLASEYTIKQMRDKNGQPFALANTKTLFEVTSLADAVNITSKADAANV